MGDFRGNPFTVSNYLWAPDLAVDDALRSSYVGSVYVPYFSDLIAVVSTDDTRFDWVRHATFTTLKAVLYEFLTLLHGSGTNPMSMAAATVLCGLDGDPGKRGHALMWIPGVPADATDDGRSFNATAWGYLLHAAQTFFAGISYPTGGLYGPVIPCTITRSRAGAPLPVAEFHPWLGLRPSYRIGTMRRRMGHSARHNPVT